MKFLNYHIIFSLLCTISLHAMNSSKRLFEIMIANTTKSVDIIAKVEEKKLWINAKIKPGQVHYFTINEDIAKASILFMLLKNDKPMKFHLVESNMDSTIGPFFALNHDKWEIYENNDAYFYKVSY